MALKRSNLRSGHLALAAITLFSGVAAALLGYAYIEKRLAEQRRELAAEQVRVVDAPQLASVLVLQRDIFRGERLKSEDLAVLRVPIEGGSAKGVLSDPAQAAGHVALQNLYAGEWLIDRKLAESEADGDVWNRLLEPGRRAIRVPVDDVTGLLGLLQPNDHVDLVAVFPGSDGTTVVSRILEQNLAVLAVGQRLLPQAGDKPEAEAKKSSVTLDVSRQQAERIALALEVGKMRLVLRNRADAQTDTSVGARLAELEGAGAMVARPSGNWHVVRVITGDNISRQEVGR
jgi:pilus assembly protein CpaB